MKKIFVNAEVDIKLLTSAEETLALEACAPVDDDLGWDDLI